MAGVERSKPDIKQFGAADVESLLALEPCVPPVSRDLVVDSSKGHSMSSFEGDDDDVDGGVGFRR